MVIFVVSWVTACMLVTLRSEVDNYKKKIMEYLNAMMLEESTRSLGRKIEINQKVSA
jgi:hypothetical protein